MRHKQQRLLEQNIQHLESYIKKHKLEDISPEDMILTITEADPDQANFKNSKWLIKNLLTKNFLWEDIEAGKSSKAYDTLSRFLNIRKQWPESNLKDINQYIGLSGIAEKIKPFEITKSSGELKREEKAKIYEETIVLYDKNDYLVVIPKTEEASCFWGRNTEWCTASTKSKNYFDTYNPNGPLIICIAPDNRKYQFHKDSDPMDENDNSLEDITDPVLVELALLTEKIKHIKHIDYTNFRHCELTVQNDGLAIQYIDKDIENYPEICKLAVQQNGWAIQHVDKAVPNYSYLCELAVQQSGLAIQYIDKTLPKYSYLCELVVQQDGVDIHLIDKAVPNYSYLCELAVKRDGLAIDYIDKNIENYLYLCELAVQQDGLTIKYIDKDISNYLYLCELAVQQNGSVIKYIDKDISNYPYLCELAVQQDGLVIQYIDKDISNYPYLCELAVQKNAWAIQHIDKDIENYSYLCQLSVQKYGLAIRYISSKIEDYPYLCELAVQQNGWAIQNISSDTPGYSELCKLAIQQNSNMITYISSKTEDYLDICKLAVQNNGLLIKHIHIPVHTANYLEVCKLAVQQNSDALIYISPKIEGYQELKKIAKENINNISEEVNKTPENKNINIPDWLTNKEYENFIVKLEENVFPISSIPQNIFSI